MIVCAILDAVACLLCLRLLSLYTRCAFCIRAAFLAADPGVAFVRLDVRQTVIEIGRRSLVVFVLTLAATATGGRGVAYFASFMGSVEYAGAYFSVVAGPALGATAAAVGLSGCVAAYCISASGCRALCGERYCVRGPIPLQPPVTYIGGSSAAVVSRPPQSSNQLSPTGSASSASALVSIPLTSAGPAATASSRSLAPPPPLAGSRPTPVGASSSDDDGDDPSAGVADSVHAVVVARSGASPTAAVADSPPLGMAYNQYYAHAEPEDVIIE